MNKIASFTINHLKLLPGLYVSRKDVKNDVVITLNKIYLWLSIILKNIRMTY